jgi:hypothetical protein
MEYLAPKVYRVPKVIQALPDPQVYRVLRAIRVFPESRVILDYRVFPALPAC